MALYTYKAVDAHGKSVMGRVEAVNLFDLEQRLARMELDLVLGAPSSTRSRLIGGGKVTRHPVGGFAAGCAGHAGRARSAPGPG